jgi:hypothetical protein
MSYTYNLIIIFLFILIMFLFCSSLSLNAEAYSNKFRKLNLSIIALDHYKFDEANCSISTKLLYYYYSDPFHIYSSDVVIKYLINIDYSLYKSKELILSPSLQSTSPLNNETEELSWYVQEKPSCSYIRLYSIEDLKRNGINVVGPYIDIHSLHSLH